MKYQSKPEYVDAEQWFPDKPVEGVIHKPFVQTGHWSDRFEDHGDNWIILPNSSEKTTVYPGNYIVTYADGSKEVKANSPKCFSTHSLFSDHA